MAKKGQDKKQRGVFEKVPGSGIWWIQYFSEGKRKRESVGRKSDAIALYQKRKADARAGIKLPYNLRQRETLAAVIERAIKWYESHRPKSLRTAQTHLEAAKTDLGSRIAAELTPSDVDHWLSRHSGWTDATKNRYKATLGRALQLAVIDGHLSRNVARMVTARREHNERIRWLRPDEETRLVEAITKDWPDYLPHFYIAMHTGMRQGEQFSLTWDEVDFERRKVFLNQTKNGSSREVPMNSTCTSAFRELWGEREERREGGKEVSEYIFTSARYRAERLLNPRQWFDVAVENAKIANFRWHDLRHTFISRLVMAGVDLKTVQDLAGHRSITMTARYAHLAPQHLAGAVEKLDSQITA